MALFHIELDEKGGPAKVKHPSYPKEVLVSRHDLGRWMQNLPDHTQAISGWIDLLPSLGVAIAATAAGVQLILVRGPEAINAHVGTAGRKESYSDEVIHFPTRVWNTHWRNGKLAQVTLWAAERAPRSLRDSALLIPFPYGNVDPPGGRICWGSVSLNHLSIENPVELETLFFRSGLNDHLFRATWLGTSLSAWAKANPGTPLPLDTSRYAQTIAQIAKLTEDGDVGQPDFDDHQDEPEEEEED